MVMIVEICALDCASLSRPGKRTPAGQPPHPIVVIAEPPGKRTLAGQPPCRNQCTSTVKTSIRARTRQRTCHLKVACLWCLQRMQIEVCQSP